LGELSNNGVKNGLLEAYISLKNKQESSDSFMKDKRGNNICCKLTMFLATDMGNVHCEVGGGGDSFIHGSLLESLDFWSLMDVKFNTKACTVPMFSTHSLYRRGIKLYIGLGTRLGISYNMA